MAGSVKGVVTVLRKDRRGHESELERYLADINKQAEEMFDTLISQYKTAEGITEQLKVDNQMQWVCKMNNIKQRVIESINENIIYN